MFDLIKRTFLLLLISITCGSSFAAEQSFSPAQQLQFSDLTELDQLYASNAQTRHFVDLEFMVLEKEEEDEKSKEDEDPFSSYAIKLDKYKYSVNGRIPVYLFSIIPDYNRFIQSSNEIYLRLEIFLI